MSASVALTAGCKKAGCPLLKLATALTALCQLYHCWRQSRLHKKALTHMPQQQPNLALEYTPGYHRCRYCTRLLRDTEYGEDENCCDPQPTNGSALNWVAWMSKHRSPVVTSTGDLHVKS